MAIINGVDDSGYMRHVMWGHLCDDRLDVGIVRGLSLNQTSTPHAWDMYVKGHNEALQCKSCLFTFVKPILMLTYDVAHQTPYQLYMTSFSMLMIY